MSEQFTDRYDGDRPRLAEPMEHVDLLLDLHSSLSKMNRELERIARELAPHGISRVEDIDLVAQNPNGPVAQQEATFAEALQVDNPYNVWLEVRASRDGGGPVIMRVPPLTTRVQNARVREVSLRALGNPAGAMPATLTLFNRPQLPGVYALIESTVGTVASGVADDGSAPIKIAGEYHLATQTFVDGQRASLQVDAHGNLRVRIFDASENDATLSVNLGNDNLGTGNRALGVGAIGYGYTGSGLDRVRLPNVFKEIQNVVYVAGTPQAVWTPAAGKKFRLMGYNLSLSVAGEVLFKEAGAEFLRTPAMAAGVGQSSPEPMGNGILASAANDALQLDVSAGGNVNGYVFGVEE